MCVCAHVCVCVAVHVCVCASYVDRVHVCVCVFVAVAHYFELSVP